MVPGLLCFCSGDLLRIYIYKIEKRYLSDDYAQHKQCNIRGRMLSVYGTIQMKYGRVGGMIIRKMILKNTYVR